MLANIVLAAGLYAWFMLFHTLGGIIADRFLD